MLKCWWRWAHPDPAEDLSWHRADVPFLEDSDPGMHLVQGSGKRLWTQARGLNVGQMGNDSSFASWEKFTVTSLVFCLKKSLYKTPEHCIEFGSSWRKDAKCGSKITRRGWLRDPTDSDQLLTGHSG